MTSDLSVLSLHGHDKLGANAVMGDEAKAPPRFTQHAWTDTHWQTHNSFYIKECTLHRWKHTSLSNPPLALQDKRLCNSEGMY